MLPLALGTVLAIGALAYVLFPLFIVPVRRAPVVESPVQAAEQDAVVALREIEFDRETGKLSPGDYSELKTRYTERALVAMRRQDAAPVASDPAEEAVRAFRARVRSCASCGPRPEPDASYCSDCGSYLAGRCAACGTAIPEIGAAFCSACGCQLAA